MNFKLVSSGKGPYIIDVKGAKHGALGDCPEVHQTSQRMCLFLQVSLLHLKLNVNPEAGRQPGDNSGGEHPAGT